MFRTKIMPKSRTDADAFSCFVVPVTTGMTVEPVSERQREPYYVD